MAGARGTFQESYISGMRNVALFVFPIMKGEGLAPLLYLMPIGVSFPAIGQNQLYNRVGSQKWPVDSQDMGVSTACEAREELWTMLGPLSSSPESWVALVEKGDPKLPWS